MDENLAWLTQKTEESKCNKASFTSSCTYTQQLQWNCKGIKKVTTPPFLHQPSLPFLGLSPLSSKIFGTSQVTQFLDRPTPSTPFSPPFNKGGGGGGVQLWYLSTFIGQKFNSFSIVLSIANNENNIFSLVTTKKSTFLLKKRNSKLQALWNDKI